MRFWVLSPPLSTVSEHGATEGVVFLFRRMNTVPPMPCMYGYRWWAQAVRVVEGRCLRLGPGWAILLCHLAQRPESILGIVSTPVKWVVVDGAAIALVALGTSRPGQQRSSSMNYLATLHGPGRAGACGGMSSGLSPCCPPGSRSSLTHCFLEGHYPLGRSSAHSSYALWKALGDNSREEGCSSSEGGAVEGLGTGPHPGLC